MLELGYAIAKKGPDKVILVANTAKTDPADLPFDIRNRRMMLADLNDANKTAITHDLAQILQNHQAGPTRGSTPQFEILTERDGWANWGGNQLGSGFRYRIRIDNFEGRTDYVSKIKIISLDEQGNPWEASHFKFDGHNPNQQLKIEENEIKDVWVFITDAPGQMQRQLPGIDEDIVRMVITLRSDGKEVEFPIPPGRLRNRP